MRGALYINAADLEAVHKKGNEIAARGRLFWVETSDECVTEPRLEAVSSFSIGEVSNVVF